MPNSSNSPNARGEGSAWRQASRSRTDCSLQVDECRIATVLPILVGRRPAGEVDAHEVVEHQRAGRLGELVQPGAALISRGLNTLPSLFHLNTSFRWGMSSKARALLDKLVTRIEKFLDPATGLNIITSMIDNQGTNGSPNCGYVIARLEELELDALRLEFFPRVEILTTDCIDVNARRRPPCRGRAPSALSVPDRC